MNLEGQGCSTQAKGYIFNGVDGKSYMIYGIKANRNNIDRRIMNIQKRYNKAYQTDRNAGRFHVSYSF